MTAIEHANRILDWQENLFTEDVPPRWMWHLEHEIVLWFEEVAARRNNPSTDVDEEAGSMMQNELVSRR